MRDLLPRNALYICLCIINPFSAYDLDINNYYSERLNIIEDEDYRSLGGRVPLTKEEAIANDILMQLKYKEVDGGFHDPRNYNFSNHYFNYRDQIKDSKVFQIIRKMPKGAVLHVHASAMLGPDSILELTYEDYLYACFENKYINFRFSETVPEIHCHDGWNLLSDLRNSTENVTKFDEDLKKYFTLNSGDIFANENAIWVNFEQVFRTIKTLKSYRPVREKMLYNALKKFYEDNILYLEMRSGLDHLYELNGTIHDRMYLARLYERVTKQFIQDYPDFIGAKLILTTRRNNINGIRPSLDMARELIAEVPDFFAGFDLVGQEDTGKPLLEFVPELLEAKSEMNYYFHGGETNWFGMPSDENLIDAVLLGSKRIGHGYALVKHPNLIEAVKRNDIAIEVNVISNAILSLVRDVRNHPLATYLALSLPVVLSSDDPGFWGAEPLSHDFYITFMGVASRKADLRVLKQLAINSIRYSALNDRDKTRAFQIFNKNWDAFIADLINHNCTLT